MTRRIFKIKTFIRWFKSTFLDDIALSAAVEEMERGLIDARLADGFYKNAFPFPAEENVEVIDEKRMEEYDALCLPRVPEYSARDIKKIRSLYSLNQKQLAAIMNISDSTVQKWERGAKKPAGSSRKLLYILEKKGISAFL